MPRKSSVTVMLPPADIKELDSLIGSGRYTLDELVEWLASRGYTISRSALHRHGVEVQRVAERMQQSDRVTEALVRELKDATIEGKQGRLLVKMTRDLVFDFLMKKESGEDLSPKDFANLGKTLAELGRSQRFAQDFEQNIRKEERQKAADTVAEAVKSQGLTADQAAFIRGKILGVPVDGQDE